MPVGRRQEQAAKQPEEWRAEEWPEEEWRVVEWREEEWPAVEMLAEEWLVEEWREGEWRVAEWPVEEWRVGEWPVVEWRRAEETGRREAEMRPVGLRRERAGAGSWPAERRWEWFGWEELEWWTERSPELGRRLRPRRRREVL